MDSKYLLKCRINSARNKIDDLENEIRILRNKIEHLEASYEDKCKQQARMESVFEKKRLKNAAMRNLVRGVALMSIVQLYEEEYGYSKSNMLSDNYEQIKGFIKLNIEKMSDDIIDKQSEISSLEYSIRQMKRRILEIEEEEREALNE